MDYEGVSSVVCDAEESDWLDVSYSERKYVSEPRPAEKKAKFKFRLTKSAKIAVVAVLCVALLALLLFVDGQFAKDVFKTAKEAFLTTLFESKPQEVSTAIAIPSNADLVDISDGVAVFEGGRTVLAFANGTVTEVGENYVAVSLDDDTSVVYGNLTDIYVTVGQDVSANALLAKYDGTFTASVTVSGQTITDVVGSETQLTWKV